jgi:hypothetical protein
MAPKTLLVDVLVRRDGGSGNPQTDSLGSDWWWTSPTAYAIKWGIIGGIFVFFLVFFFGGYFHARRRMKNGLAPLGYHRVCQSDTALCEIGLLTFSSGSSLADNEHNLNHLVRMMCPSTVCKTVMQCTAIHLRLQVCRTPVFERKFHRILTLRIQPTTPMATTSHHILHQKAPQRLIPPRVMRRSHLPALLQHHFPQKGQATKRLW